MWPGHIRLQPGTQNTLWPGHIRPQPGTQNTQTSVAGPHHTTAWYTEHPDQCGRATSDHNMVHRTPRPVWPGHIRPQHRTQNTQTSVAGPHQTTTWYTEHPYQYGRATSDHNLVHRTPRPVWPGHIRPQHGAQNTQTSVARPHQTTTWYTEHPDQCCWATSDHNMVHRTPRPVWPGRIRPQPGTQNTQTSVAGPHQTTAWYTEHPDQCGRATSDYSLVHRTPRPVWPGHIRPQPGTQNTQTSVAGPHQTTTWHTEHPDQCGRATSDHNMAHRTPRPVCRATSDYSLVHRTPRPVWPGHIRPQHGTQNTQTSVAGPHQTTTWHTEHPDQCGQATSDYSLVHRTPRPVWPGHIRPQPGTQNTQTSVAGPHQITAWYTEHPDQCGQATSDHSLVHRTPRPVWPGHIRLQHGTQNTQTSVAGPHQTTTWYTEHPDQCGRATSDHNMVHRTHRPVWPGHIRPQHGTQNTQTGVAGPHQTTTWYTEHPDQCGWATSDHNMAHRTPRPVWPGHIRPQHGTQNTQTSMAADHIRQQHGTQNTQTGVAGPHQTTTWHTEHPDRCGWAASDHNMAHRTPRPVWPPTTSDNNMAHRTPRPVWPGHIRPQHGTQNTQTSVARPHQTTAWYTEHPDQCGRATSDHNMVHRTPRPVWLGHIRPQHGTQNTQTSVARPHQTTTWYTEHPDQCGRATSDHSLVHRTPRPVWPPTTSDNNMAQGYRMREADTSTLFLNTICPGANRY